MEKIRARRKAHENNERRKNRRCGATTAQKKKIQKREDPPRFVSLSSSLMRFLRVIFSRRRNCLPPHTGVYLSLRKLLSVYFYSEKRRDKKLFLPPVEERARSEKAHQKEHEHTTHFWREKVSPPPFCCYVLPKQRTRRYELKRADLSRYTF